jgi:hypothetical protein
MPAFQKEHLDGFVNIFWLSIVVLTFVGELG